MIVKLFIDEQGKHIGTVVDFPEKWVAISNPTQDNIFFIKLCRVCGPVEVIDT